MNFMRTFKLSLLCPILISAFSINAVAQTPPLKGHVIGESIQQFLSESDYLATRLSLCRGLKDPKSARKQRLDWNICQQLIGAVDHNGLAIVDSNCYADRMPPTADHIQGTSLRCLGYEGKAIFLEGKLAAMRVKLVDPWGYVLTDLVKAFGPPTHEGQTTLQNAFGAQFILSNATWTTDKFNLKAEENYGTFGNQYRQIAIGLMTSDAYAKVMTAEGERKSTIE